ncbi:MAG: hypothetical protein KGN01_07840 [Patescibacteria group bacterium]|nr:hypothetical protein [Patescibacteria group bacterium]
MLRLAIATSTIVFILIVSAHIVGSKASSRQSNIEAHVASRNASDDWVDKLPDPCYLSNVECPWKKVMRISHYGWTGNKMSNGQYPYVGAVATSDRTIPLGSKVEIAGRDYTVADRTAKWIGKKRGDTIDIYSNDPKGLAYEEVYFK